MTDISAIDGRWQVARSSEGAPLPTPTLYILVALRRGDRHGYAIMQDVAELSDGAIRIGPGTLYGALQRLEAAGWVVEVDAADPRRRTYALTPVGARACDAELDRLEALVHRARRGQPRTAEA